MKNIRGLTLIEITISLFILSIFLLLLNSFLSISLFLGKTSESNLFLIQDVRYTLEKIHEDILLCDKIIPDDNVENLWAGGFDDNFGFIIVKSFDNDTDNFTLYYRDKKYKNIKRVACSKPKGVYPKYSDFLGYNDLSGGINSIGNSRLDIDNKKVVLELIVIDDTKNQLSFNREISLTCPIGY